MERYEIEVDITIFDAEGKMVASRTAVDDIDMENDEFKLPRGFWGDVECALDEMLEKLVPELDYDEVMEKIRNALTEREYEFLVGNFRKVHVPSNQRPGSW